MPVYTCTAFDAMCDTCDAAFSPWRGLITDRSEFADYGWIVTDTGTVLCDNCARREGIAA